MGPIGFGVVVAGIIVGFAILIGIWAAVMEVRVTLDYADAKREKDEESSSTDYS